MELLGMTLKQEQINWLGSEKLFTILDNKLANLEIDPFFYSKQTKIYCERRNFLKEKIFTSYRSEEDLGFLATQKFDQVLQEADISNFETDRSIGTKAVLKFLAPHNIAMAVRKAEEDCENKEKKECSEDQETQEDKQDAPCKCNKEDASTKCDCVLPDILCYCIKCKTSYDSIQKLVASQPQAGRLAEDLILSSAFLHPLRARTLKGTTMLRVLELGLEQTGLPRSVQKTLRSGPRGLDLGTWQRRTKRACTVLRHMFVKVRLTLQTSEENNGFFWKGRKEFAMNTYKERTEDTATLVNWFVSRSTDPEELVNVLLQESVIGKKSGFLFVDTLKKAFSKHYVSAIKHLESSPNAVFLCMVTRTSISFKKH